jgi:MFS family permease
MAPRACWAMLALVSVVELLAMSLWFAANAAAPHLAARWGLDASGIGALTSAVQLGFVAGTAAAALLNLADVWPARAYVAGSAALAGLANLALLAAPGPGVGMATRFLTGFFLAGVYPPGMKMVATWFRADRGLAIGTVVGALAVGKALPWLVHAFGQPGLGFIVVSTSCGAWLAAALVLAGYRDGPHPFARRPFAWSLIAVVARHRETRLATASYLGHMWELYAMWTWVPAFVAASLARSSPGLPRWVADLAAFGALAAGGIGCVWGGWAARRMGYVRVVTLAMAASGACALAVGFLGGAPPWIVVPLVGAWGFFVVADSAQFSALVTEVTPSHAVGTALTLQVSIGFLLTMATIQLVPAIERAIGWGPAFAALAAGPGLGIAAIRTLARGAGGAGIAERGRA